jgi:hypothetical protein
MEFAPRGENVWLSARDDNKVVILRYGDSFAKLGEIAADSPSGIFLYQPRCCASVSDETTPLEFRLLNEFQRDFPLCRRRLLNWPRALALLKKWSWAGWKSCAVKARFPASAPSSRPSALAPRHWLRWLCRRSNWMPSPLRSTAFRGQSQLRARAPLQPVVRRHRR